MTAHDFQKWTTFCAKPHRREYDAERRAYLESQGIRVLYFENRALLELSKHVMEVIRSVVAGHRPVCGVKVAIATLSYCRSHPAWPGGAICCLTIYSHVHRPRLLQFRGA